MSILFGLTEIDDLSDDVFEEETIIIKPIYRLMIRIHDKDPFQRQCSCGFSMGPAGWIPAV